MATFAGNFPRRATLIDELTRRDHCYLQETDVCAFIGEYTARAGYEHSQTNQLIFNLKKSPERRGRAEWSYKEKAIRQAGRTFEAVLTEQALDDYTFVPIPPSRARGETGYDNRMSQVIQAIRPSRSVDMRELIVQTESTEAAHDSRVRLSPHEIAGLYRIDEALTTPKPLVVVVVDDVLTTGAHFKATQSLLRSRFPGVSVFGLFVARRALPKEGSSPVGGENLR